MSEKMKKFLNKVQPRKIIKEDTKPKTKPIQNLLNETVIIDPADKEKLYHNIEQPGNTQFVLATYADEYQDVDRTVVISRKSGNMVLVILNSELEEISDFIVEMCDQMGWVFTSVIQDDTSNIIFEIFVR